MARSITFIRTNYGLEQNAFPATAIIQWGSSDERENGSLYNSEVGPDGYSDAISKFVVGPIDSGSKFQFLWSLGDGDEARGYGKTSLLRYLARILNGDLGLSTLLANEFDEKEAKATPVIAAMGTFNTNDVTTLAAVCLEQVRYLAQPDAKSGVSPLMLVRERFLDQSGDELPADDEDDMGAAVAGVIKDRVKDTSLSLAGKTLGSPDRILLDHFATGNWRGLTGHLRESKAKDGFNLLSSVLVIARAAGVKRALLFIDQVEDFASADTPKKRRALEVERFRDIAIETQPFGDMTSFVLTMHPAAARAIEEYWSLARLPKIDHLMKQSERITVVLRAIKNVEDAEKLFESYLGKFRRKGTAFDSLHPFNRAAIRVILEERAGRAGPMLELAHHLIEEGAQQSWMKIGEEEVRQFVEPDGERNAPKASPRRRRIGALEGE